MYPDSPHLQLDFFSPMFNTLIFDMIPGLDGMFMRLEK